MLAHGVAFFVLSVVGIARAGNTTCKNTSLDWFTQSVGETPCRVYERLRQTCSPGYEVGNMAASPPGDVCNDRLAACCCNSVAFALSMLCINCQYGVGSSTGNDHGVDAVAGTYDRYLNGCLPSINAKLPNMTQEAVCKQGIKIPSYAYEPFWSTGEWNYDYTRGVAQLQIQGGNNDTGLCPTTSMSASASATATGSPASTSPATDSGSSTNVGAIAGGVVAGVVLLALAVLTGFFLARRRKQRGFVDITEGHQTPDVAFEPYHMPPAVSTQAEVSSPHTVPNPSGWRQPDAPSSTMPTPNPSSRRHKPGLIAPTPPTQAETHDSPSRHLPPPGILRHLDERHEDSDALTNAYGLGRSPSGRLPPSYQMRSK